VLGATLTAKGNK